MSAKVSGTPLSGLTSVVAKPVTPPASVEQGVGHAFDAALEKARHDQRPVEQPHARQQPSTPQRTEARPDRSRTAERASADAHATAGSQGRNQARLQQSQPTHTTPDRRAPASAHTSASRAATTARQSGTSAHAVSKSGQPDASVLAQQAASVVTPLAVAAAHSDPAAADSRTEPVAGTGRTAVSGAAATTSVDLAGLPVSAAATPTNGTNATGTSADGEATAPASDPSAATSPAAATDAAVRLDHRMSPHAGEAHGGDSSPTPTAGATGSSPAAEAKPTAPSSSVTATVTVTTTASQQPVAVLGHDAVTMQAASAASMPAQSPAVQAEAAPQPPSADDHSNGRAAHDASSVKPASYQPATPQPAAQQATAQQATVGGEQREAPDGRDSSDERPAQDHTSGQPHAHDTGSLSSQLQATPYSSVQGRTAAGTPSTDAAVATGGDAEVPTTQALPAGTLQQVNGAEHSVRVQLHTEALGRLTADVHTRPGEMAVQLTVPDDAGRALMAQRMDALRDSLGQSGTAVHLSLTAHDGSQDSPQYQGFSTSQGQQGNTPREDRAQAPSAPQPHDAVTPRATDGSSVLPAPAGGTRLVDVRA